ncbi:hypothetical protein D3C77_535560 [compost metagenome]
MHQCIANHEVDQRRRHPQLLGNVLLRHAMQAVHLEGIACALRQFVQGLGNVIQRGEVDMGGFGRGVLHHHVQAFLLAAGVLQLHRLLAIVVDGQVAHDLEQVAQLRLERRGDLRGGTESEEGILHYIFRA